MALETSGLSGVYGPAAAAFIQDLGRRIAARTGERRETAWLRQRLSVAIARGNAASVLATAPHADMTTLRKQDEVKRNSGRIESQEPRESSSRLAEEQRLPEKRERRPDEPVSPSPSRAGAAIGVHYSGAVSS